MTAIERARVLKLERAAEREVIVGQLMLMGVAPDADAARDFIARCEAIRVDPIVAANAFDAAPDYERLDQLLSAWPQPQRVKWVRKPARGTCRRSRQVRSSRGRQARRVAARSGKAGAA